MEEVIKVNEYLIFLVKTGKNGTAITAIYDEQIIGKKRPCKHAKCNTMFIAEMTLIAKQMLDFEKVFEPVVPDNLN